MFAKLFPSNLSATDRVLRIGLGVALLMLALVGPEDGMGLPRPGDCVRRNLPAVHRVRLLIVPHTQSHITNAQAFELGAGRIASVMICAIQNAASTANPKPVIWSGPSWMVNG